MSSRSRRWSVAAMLGGAMLACAEDDRPQRDAPSPGAPGTEAVRTTGFDAGAEVPRRPVTSPFPSGPHTIAEGERLYNWFNCTGCHGGEGGGGIGPPFADEDWIYGSEPGNIYQSIVQGRPNGMPSFEKIPPAQVWRIVAYVRSLSPESTSDQETSARSGLGAGESQETDGAGSGGVAGSSP